MLSNLFNKFAQLPPIKKLVVGTAVAGSLVLGGVTLDKAVDADWGQDSSGWTQAQRDHRHAERWREIGQGAVIILNAIQQADQQQQQQSPPPTTTYPDYHPRQYPQQQDNGGGYNQQQRQTRRDAPVIIPQQTQPSPRPTITPSQEEHKTAPVIIPQTVPAPAPKPPVDWTEKYKHVDDFNRNATPPVKKDKPAYDTGGVEKPNNNGNWMDKYKAVTPVPASQKSAPPAASKQSFSSSSKKR